MEKKSFISLAGALRDANPQSSVEGYPSSGGRQERSGGRGRCYGRHIARGSPKPTPAVSARLAGFVDWGFGMFGARPAWVWQGFSMFLAKVWQVGVCRVFLPMVWKAMVFFLAAIGQGSRGFWRA